MSRHVLTVLTLLFLMLGIAATTTPNPAAAQAAAAIARSEAAPASAAPTLPDPLTPEAITAMVARMSDDQVRSMLLDRLDAVAKSETGTTAPVGLATRLEMAWTSLYTPTLNAVRALPNLVSGEIRAVGNFVNAFPGNSLLMMLVYTAIALAAGFAAEYVVNIATRRWQDTEAMGAEPDLSTTLHFLFRRFMRELVGLIAFYVVLRTVGVALLSPQQLSFAGPAVTFLIWLPRLAAALGRFILAPNEPAVRLVTVDDHWAKYLYRHLIGLVLLVGITRFAITFNIIAEVPLSETRIGFWFNGAFHIYLALIAWQARDALTALILGSDPDRTEFDLMVARNYPYYAIAVTALMWITVQLISGSGHNQLLLNGAHYTTMFWLLMAPALDTLIRGLVRHLLPPMSGDGAVAEGAYKSTKRSYIRIGRVLVWASVILLIASAWNINLISLRAGTDGFADNIMEFLMLLAIGYIVFEVVSLWINRRLAKEQTSEATPDESAGEGGGAGGSRLATVLPLVRVSAQTGIAVIFSLLAIGALGIDITPLLAGAGILGLAIGFGAQKLVSDVVSGIFFLVDDAFRVGEYVEVDGTMGTVEKISIRSMQLRHHRGLVHTIPYGEIPKLTNYSRDWVIMKLMFTVPFDTDPNKVKKIFKKIGAEMMEDPTFKDDFLEPFKSQGVLQFDDVGIVMRGKFMAKPGTQFTIRKEIYNRVRKEFAENGIEFARREVRVAIPGFEHEEHLDDVQKQAVATAAGAAVQSQLAKEQAENK